jgi:hypothetical protein
MDYWDNRLDKATNNRPNPMKIEPAEIALYFQNKSLKIYFIEKTKDFIIPADTL